MHFVSKAQKPFDSSKLLTSIVCDFVQFALAMWSSLQQKYEAVFKPLKPLISKEMAASLLSGRVFNPGVFTAF